MDRTDREALPSIRRTFADWLALSMRRYPVWLMTAWFVVAGSRAVGDDHFFREQVEPLLQQRCYACHAHQSHQMEGGLTLDWRRGWEQGGDQGPAVVPGEADKSLLIRAVSYEDDDLRMPPEGRLPDQEIAILREWITRGAPDPRVVEPVQDVTKWWSLNRLSDSPSLPTADRATPTAGRHPLDIYLNRKLMEVGLTPRPRADLRTLVRRLYIDLHGVAPTADELHQFENDRRPDAWVRLVDRLLASPRYGERAARHWLDVIHFADTHGYEHDALRPDAWRFRDYVIDRWNDDVPWSRLIREQIAADVFFPEEPALTAALGFLGAGPYDQSAAGTAPKMFEYLDRDDLVTQTMAAFTSTTAQCARCHAHKFDPISQEDYYALQAVFAGVGKGSIQYDADVTTQRRRREIRQVQQAVEQNNRDALLSPALQTIVREWESRRGSSTSWMPLDPLVFVSTGGATLTREPDHSIVSAGTRPDIDTTIVTAYSPRRRITALKIEVLADDRLPQRGPGRADNGNFHLNEVVLQILDRGAAQSRLGSWSTSVADWEQVDWTAFHAMDSKGATAWGIHPAEGTSHQIVLLCAQPYDIATDAQLVVTLQQTHGRGHVLGRFRISITDDSQPLDDVLSPELASLLTIPASQRSSEQQQHIARIVLGQWARQQASQLPTPRKVYGAASQVDNERGQLTWDRPRPIHLLHRGDLEQPREEMVPGALSAVVWVPHRFTDLVDHPETLRRAALADWIAHRDNPLTWRSIVNRVWQQHFGHGLCDTPNDFGHMGSLPTHPELLEWLAVWFRDDAQGSLKALHRLMVTSDAYQRDSVTDESAQRIDPDNRWLGRQTRQRLDAESFRDSILAQSGHLSLEMKGPSVPQFSSRPGPQVTPILNYHDFDWNGPLAARRSIYRVVWRGIPDPLMDALDFPDLGMLSPTRGFSASAVQALALWNHDFVLERAHQLALQSEKWSAESSERVERLAWIIWLRRPTPEEHAALVSLAESHGLAAVCRVLWNSNEFLFVD